MILEFRGEKKQYPDNLTVEQWLDFAGIPNKEVALVQVNAKDVSPNKRETHPLSDGDCISLLYFLGDS